MITRRNALKLGAAGAAAAVASVSTRSMAALGIGSTGGLGRAVFDERYHEAHAFARELEHLGVATSRIRGDVAALWYQDLRAQLQTTVLPFAGLTDRAALFCFEELARDVGMKVRYRVDRVLEQAGRVRHEVHGAPAAVEATRNLGADENFGRAMARLAAEFDGRLAGSMAAQRRTGPFGPRNGTALVAWIIA